MPGLPACFQTWFKCAQMRDNYSRICIFLFNSKRFTRGEIAGKSMRVVMQSCRFPRWLKPCCVSSSRRWLGCRGIRQQDRKGRWLLLNVPRCGILMTLALGSTQTQALLQQTASSWKSVFGLAFLSAALRRTLWGCSAAHYFFWVEICCV